MTFSASYSQPCRGLLWCTGCTLHHKQPQSDTLPQEGPSLYSLQGDVMLTEALSRILFTEDGQSRLLAAFINRAVPVLETGTLLAAHTHTIQRVYAWNRSVAGLVSA